MAGVLNLPNRIHVLIPLIVGISIGCAISSLFLTGDSSVCVDGAKSLESFPSRLYRPQSSEELPRKLPSIKSPGKPSRPYFASSELKPKEHLLVSVLLTSKTLLKSCLVINVTWASVDTRVIFFTPYLDDETEYTRLRQDHGVKVVQLTDVHGDTTTFALALLAFQHLRDIYHREFMWFLMVNGETYVRSRELTRMLSQLSTDDFHYIGHPIMDRGTGLPDNNLPASYCDGRSGILISNSLLDWVGTAGHCDSADQRPYDEALGRCLKAKLGISCTVSVQARAKFINNAQPFSFNRSLPSWLQQYEHAAVISPLSSINDVLSLHISMMLVEKGQLLKTSDGLGKSIMDLSSKVPLEFMEHSLSWPIGFVHPYRPKTRYEVLPWSYFNSTHIYGDSDLDIVRPLVGPVQLEISQVIAEAEKIAAAARPSYRQARLLNGYRRLDLIRGTEYLVEIEMTFLFGRPETVQVSLLRPLMKVQNLPMPVAAETRLVHVVVPVLPHEIDTYQNFLHMFRRVCLETGENVVLVTVLVHLSSSKKSEKENDNTFEDIISLISNLKRLHPWAELPWMQVRMQNYSHVLAADILAMKLNPNSLVFYTQLSIEFNTNMLNRCRSIAVPGFQVFSPIPFAEYDPTLATVEGPPVVGSVHGDSGVWDYLATDVACFTLSDYKNLRSERDDFLWDEGQVQASIISVFMASSSLQVLRAVEPELKRLFTPVDCNRTRSFPDLEHCLDYASMRLAHRKQLAQYWFSHKS